MPGPPASRAPSAARARLPDQIPGGAESLARLLPGGSSQSVSARSTKPSPRRSPAKPDPGAPPLHGLAELFRGLVSAGLTNREIAERLAIAEGTAKLHVSAAMRRIGARNRPEAARMLRGA